MQDFFIGIDGGATKTRIRIESQDGVVIGETLAGMANIRISVDEAWESILNGIYDIITPAKLSLNDSQFAFHVGMGLAGCEVTSAYHDFIARAHPFASLTVTSDAEIACLGAHGAHDGAIIISGTGAVGLQLQKGAMSKVGGWGFPHDDKGGGAWLGLAAMTHTLRALDGRDGHTALTDKVLHYFDHDQKRMTEWSNTAKSTQWALLAPIVISLALEKNQQAITLLQLAANEIDAIASALLLKQTKDTPPLPCALLGTISNHLQPYLSTSLQQRLVKPLAAPEVGAILLARRHHQGVTA